MTDALVVRCIIRDTTRPRVWIRCGDGRCGVTVQRDSGHSRVQSRVRTGVPALRPALVSSPQPSERIIGTTMLTIASSGFPSAHELSLADGDNESIDALVMEGSIDHRLECLAVIDGVVRYQEAAWDEERHDGVVTGGVGLLLGIEEAEPHWADPIHMI